MGNPARLYLPSRVRVQNHYFKGACYALLREFTRVRGDPFERPAEFDTPQPLLGGGAECRATEMRNGAGAIWRRRPRRPDHL